LVQGEGDAFVLGVEFAYFIGGIGGKPHRQFY
jgi:hypothetical protein